MGAWPRCTIRSTGISATSHAPKEGSADTRHDAPVAASSSCASSTAFVRKPTGNWRPTVLALRPRMTSMSRSVSPMNLPQQSGREKKLCLARSSAGPPDGRHHDKGPGPEEQSSDDQRPHDPETYNETIIESLGHRVPSLSRPAAEPWPPQSAPSPSRHPAHPVPRLTVMFAIGSELVRCAQKIPSGNAPSPPLRSTPASRSSRSSLTMGVIREKRTCADLSP